MGWGWGAGWPTTSVRSEPNKRPDLPPRKQRSQTRTRDHPAGRSRDGNKGGGVAWVGGGMLDLFTSVFYKMLFPPK